ncbi:MAG: type II secretion system protein GspJ [Thermodesulfobacteriota bacterium]|nr:type II secretion system protein GspJ [Thermodesulfobacteriota bacterium]
MRKRWNLSHSSQKNERSKGFTLAEILIAIAIISTILAIVYSSFASTMRSITICREKNDIYQIARLSLERIAEDVSAAFPPKDLQLEDIQLGFIGEDREVSGIPWDTLHFISTSHLELSNDIKSSGLHEIGYSLEMDLETDQPVLFRRQDDTLDDETDKGGVVLELAEGINGIDFKYYDDEGEEFNEWLYDDKNALPKMIKITLSFKDQDGNNIDFSTQVYLEMWGG